MRRRRLLAMFVALQFLVPAGAWVVSETTGQYNPYGWRMFSGR